MKILFVFYNHPHLSVIQRSLLKAFKSNGHTIVTCGRNESKEKLDIEFTSAHVSLSEILTKINSIFDLIFICWPSRNFYVTSIENSPFPTAIWTVDTHLPLMHAWMEGYATLFDYIFCTQKKFVKLLKNKSVDHVYWLPVAADPTINKKFHVKKRHDVVFVGTINPLHNPKRSFYLKVISLLFEIKMDQVYLEDMSKLYSKAKIIINIPVADALNTRNFEALSTGTLLLTYRNQQGLLELFSDKVHLVTYSNLLDLISKIKYYLSNPTKTKAISSKGRKIVLQNHTYKHRVNFLLSKVKLSASTKKKLITKDLWSLAKSDYLLGSIPNTKKWLKKITISRSSSKLDKILVNLVMWIMGKGGNKLANITYRFYSHLSAVQIIFWQLTHL